jgi:hypothetical protein
VAHEGYLFELPLKVQTAFESQGDDSAGAGVLN